MIGFLDCSTGASGDKLLGALVSAGFELDALRAALRSMGLDAIVVDSAFARSHGVTATAITVTEHGAPRRTWRELAPLVSRADVPEPVRSGTVRALQALAEAEAGVHGVPLEDVHFHEIGAADTIADVLGVALGLHALGIERLVCSPVAVGSGTVASEHGTLPVPAPATALLLAGMPVLAGQAPGELTTPTGAALLYAFVSEFGAIPAMTIRAVGTGCGTRDLGSPNICRLLLGEPEPAPRATETIALLEANLDHLSPEHLAHAAQRLLEAGALDVWQTPIVMKKGRAAVTLSALAATPDAASLAERFLAETGSLGVRLTTLERRTLARTNVVVETSLGSARYKVAELPDGRRVARVEYDDASRIAAAHELLIAEAAATLEAEAAESLDAEPHEMRQRPSSETTKPSA